MKILIAVMSCAMYRNSRVKSQRETWLKDKHPGLDVRFFYGRSINPIKDLKEDEVVLNVPDDYPNFPLKVKAMFGWSVEQGYDWTLKIDDDVYGVLSRIAEAIPERGQYVGRLRGPSGNKPAPYASGFSYWLTKKAAAIVAAAKWDTDPAEDRFVANVLHQHGIECEPDYRYVVHQSKRNSLSGKEGPRQNNGIVTSCEYEIEEHMQLAHHHYLNSPSGRPNQSIPDGSLRDVDILIKTFMRDGYLAQCLAGLEMNFRSARFILVDDGYEKRPKITQYADLRFWGHKALWMPFDSGFGAKSNKAIPHATRKYLLIGSDDFDFTPDARKGVEQMLDVLESRPDIGVCCGHVNNVAYEGNFRQEGTVLIETPFPGYPIERTKKGTEYYEVDLAVNYGLVRTELFKQGLHWCPEWKIGGDHFRFYDDVKKLGWKTAVVPTANIRPFPNVSTWKMSGYDEMRHRAWDALPGFFKHQGITEYRLFDGSRDVLEGDVLKHYLPNGRVTKEVPVTPSNSTVSCAVCGYKKVL